MGLHLILFASNAFWLTLGFWYNILLVLVGLGLVIFVHELGHFAVAKWCGVKCEKFYLGFDLFGLKLCRFRWGETEYGIGILPLGGYVKMLGQEDNPARLREEVQRAKAGSSPAGRAGGETGEGAEGGAKSDEPAGARSESFDLAAAEEALFNPRSYLAKSVPKRMAIISAGVIMNVVFAFVCAGIAYGMGVFQISCGVGAVAPGEAAWRANLRVGDDILAIAGKPVKRFSEMQAAISVGDIENGVAMKLRRPGVPEPLDVTVVPDRVRVIPTIGISNPRIPTLVEPHPAGPDTPADRARPAFQGGDTIVACDGKPVRTFADYHAQEALHPEKTLAVTVERASSRADGQTESPATQRLTIPVAPRPMRWLGLVMGMSPVTAVQPDSPADQAGIRPGDRITAIDGRPPENPMILPYQLRRRSQEPGAVVQLTVERPGRTEPLQREVPLRQAGWYEQPLFIGNGVSIPVLGIAYQVDHHVRSVVPGGPAAQAGLKAGDRVVRAEFLPPDEEARRARGVADREVPSLKPFSFSHDKPNWATFLFALQEALPGTRVRLTLEDDQTVDILPEETEDWFNPNRGFQFQPKGYVLQAESVAEALYLGGEETLDALTLVFQFLHRLGTQQVSPRAFGGPVTIAKIAYRSAARGIPDLLVFLCLISANLAVINFLPIPVLDGGHMMFLAYEGLRGKPPSERVHVTLSYLGLAFILALMVFVLGLDFEWIPRD